MQNENEFEVGDLVRWYVYSSEQIIIEGGVGTVVGKEDYRVSNLSMILMEILCADGKIKSFEPFALEKV